MKDYTNTKKCNYRYDRLIGTNWSFRSRNRLRPRRWSCCAPVTVAKTSSGPVALGATAGAGQSSGGRAPSPARRRRLHPWPAGSRRCRTTAGSISSSTTSRPPPSRRRSTGSISICPTALVVRSAQQQLCRIVQLLRRGLPWRRSRPCGYGAVVQFRHHRRRGGSRRQGSVEGRACGDDRSGEERRVRTPNRCRQYFVRRAVEPASDGGAAESRRFAPRSRTVPAANGLAVCCRAACCRLRAAARRAACAGAPWRAAPASGWRCVRLVPRFFVSAVSSMVTAGPPSVAILVAAMLVFERWRFRDRFGPADAAASVTGRRRRSRDRRELHFVIGGRCRRLSAVAACGCCRWLRCRDFRLRRLGRRGLFELQRGEFLRLGRCSRTGRLSRWRLGCTAAASSGAVSGAFSATAGRSAAGPASASAVALLGEHRFGRRPPRRDAGKFLMRGAQQRRGAKPEHQDRHRQYDRGEQKTKTGEHGREFRLAGGLQGR